MSRPVSDALFVTLDPLVRQVKLRDQRELLVSDTVGFIDRLPHALVAAFRATLEEVGEADLALHVIDAASPERERHMAAVRRVLEEVGAAGVPVIDVYNKIDVTQDESRRLQMADPAAALVSARTGEGTRRVARDGGRERLTRGASRSPSTAARNSTASRSLVSTVWRGSSVTSPPMDVSSSRPTFRDSFIDVSAPLRAERIWPMSTEPRRRFGWRWHSVGALLVAVALVAGCATRGRHLRLRRRSRIRSSSPAGAHRSRPHRVRRAWTSVGGICRSAT